MTQSAIKKLSNKNRLLVPRRYLKELGIELNSDVLVVKDSDENCIKIYKIESDTSADSKWNKSS